MSAERPETEAKRLHTLGALVAAIVAAGVLAGGVIAGRID